MCLNFCVFPGATTRFAIKPQRVGLVPLLLLLLLLVMVHVEGTWWAYSCSSHQLFWLQDKRLNHHPEHSFPAPSSKTQPELVTPLKGHSLPLRICPPTLSVPSKRFGVIIRLLEQDSVQACMQTWGTSASGKKKKRKSSLLI